MQMLKFNIVIPVFNEEEIIKQFNDKLISIISKYKYQFEIIYINDGSYDNTEALLNSFSNKYKFVKSVNFTRNFGSHAAILAGLNLYNYNPTIVMSCDFQDPPSLIGKMIDKYLVEKKIIYAIRNKRNDPFFKNLFAKSFYKLTRILGINFFPKNGNDGFGLYPPNVIKKYLELVETHRITSFLISWLGFEHEYIFFDRPQRLAGYSKWGFFKRLNSAVDVIFSFSNFPIRLSFIFGIIMLALSIFITSFLIYEKFFLQKEFNGWASIIIAVMIFGSLQMFFLGIIGEYLWRISSDVKKRPLYIVKDKIMNKSRKRKLSKKV